MTIREIVSCRAVRACARSGHLVELDPKSRCLPFPFSLLVPVDFPFSLFGLASFPFSLVSMIYKVFKVYIVFRKCIKCIKC